MRMRFSERRGVLENRLQGVCWVIAFSLVLLATVFTTPGHAYKQMVTLGAGAVSSLTHHTAGAIGRFVNKQVQENGLRMILKSTDGSIANIMALGKGTVEFGMVHSGSQFMAWNGIEDLHSEGPQKDLRSVCSLNIESLVLVAADDAQISCLSDVKGKTVSIGSFGSCQRIIAKDVLKAVKIHHHEDMDAKSLETDNQTAALMAGQIDAFFATVGHPCRGIKEAACGKRKIHFVPMSGEGIDKLLKKRPYYTQATVPVGCYPQIGNTEDVASIAVRSTLCTRIKVPEDTVYTVTKAIFENLDVLRKMHPSYEEITAEGMLEALTAPIHPGAMRYYKEVGLR